MARVTHNRAIGTLSDTDASFHLGPGTPYPPTFQGDLGAYRVQKVQDLAAVRRIVQG